MKPALPAAALDDLRRGFLRVLSQAVKQASLYGLRHPVAISAIGEAGQALHELLAETGQARAVIGISGGRWLADGAVVSSSAQEFEVLALALRAHAAATVSFRSDCRPFELSAFCELAATSPGRAYRNDPSEFLRERGVTRIEIGLEEYVRGRKVAGPACPAVQSPLAGLRERLAARSSPPSGAQSFGSFIKGLVERSVDDPQERAEIYAQTLRSVEEAVARHVAEATHRLLLERQGILNERMRSERVLAAIASGRVIVDQEGRILMMDPAAERIAGRPLSDLAGRPLLESAPPEEGFAALSKDLVIPENGPPSGQVALGGAEGSLDALRDATAVVHDEGGRVVGTMGVLPHAARYRETQRLQDEFFSRVAHDLKGPLSALSAALELLREKSGAADDEFLEIGLRNSRALQQMIEEFLDLSRLRSGSLAVRLSSAAPSDLLEKAARALTPWAQTKKITLEIADRDGRSELPAVRADPERIGHVFNILLSNAVKAAPKGGRIAVSAEPASGGVRFAVADDGPGLSPADQARLLEKAARGAGAGLIDGPSGLVVAGSILALHGATLAIDSRPGEGATFSFTLPPAPGPEAPPPDR